MDVRTRNTASTTDVVIGRWLVALGLCALIGLLALASSAPLPL